MKAHLTERSMKGLWPKQKNNIVDNEEVVGFGVCITSDGMSRRKHCAFILTYRVEARERRLPVGAWPDWSATVDREKAKRPKRKIDQGRGPRFGGGSTGRKLYTPAVQQLGSDHRQRRHKPCPCNDNCA